MTRNLTDEQAERITNALRVDSDELAVLVYGGPSYQATTATVAKRIGLTEGPYLYPDGSEYRVAWDISNPDLPFEIALADADVLSLDDARALAGLGPDD